MLAVGTNYVLSIRVTTFIRVITNFYREILSGFEHISFIHTHQIYAHEKLDDDEELERKQLRFHNTEY